jgi:hypothetical protein
LLNELSDDPAFKRASDIGRVHEVYWGSDTVYRCRDVTTAVTAKKGVGITTIFDVRDEE